MQARLARAAGAARRQLLITIGLGLLATGLIVAQASLLAHLIAGAFIEGTPLAQMTPTLVWLLATAAGRGIVSFGFEATGRLGAASVMSELRGRMLSRIALDRPGAMARERSGELIAAAIQGVDALEAYYARYLPQVALAALAPVVILAWVLPRNWEAALILGITLPLIPVFMILIGKLTEASVRRRWSRLSALSSAFLDVVSGLATLKAYARADSQAAVIGKASDDYRSETMATLRVGFLSALVLELLAMLGTALVAATVGLQLANGSLGLEAGLTVLILAPELYMPLRQMGAQFHASADGLAAAERVFEVIDLPPAVVLPQISRQCPDPLDGPLSAVDVSFAYPGDAKVLDAVNLTIGPGETVALVGASGSGKTTLASLLLRLADPTQGSVQCGGVDLREIDPSEWRSRVAWVPQRPTLFAATVAENIGLGEPSCSEREIWDAAERAGAASLIKDLPSGLHTEIGEGGRRLSAGQAQRVALARAFLRDPSFIVLDEPTAHLDHETASDLWDSLAELLDRRSALLVVHRPELARMADRVVELQGGKIEANPSWQEIAA